MSKSINFNFQTMVNGSFVCHLLSPWKKGKLRKNILLHKFGKLALSVNVFLIPFNSQDPWTAKRGTCDKKNISGRGLHESCHSKMFCRRKKNKVTPEPRENSLKIVP